MVDLVLTVMISALSLAQPGGTAITTNELPPPPGMSAANETAPVRGKKAPTRPTSAQAGPVTATENATPTETAPRQAPTAPGTAAPEKNGAAQDVQPAPESERQPPAAWTPETAQPTTEERQTPTPKQAKGSAGPGRVAAFWFILPNRPQETK